MPIETGIVIPDSHRPFHDERAWQLLLHFMAETKPTHTCFIGDWGDFAGISHHNTGRGKLQNEQRLIDCIESCRQGFDERERANPKSKVSFCEGNHEAWLSQFMDKYPSLQGFMNIERVLEMRERGIEFYSWYGQNKQRHPIRPAWGKLQLAHTTSAGSNHATALARVESHSVVYGNSHDMQSASKVMKGELTRRVWSCGHLVDVDSDAFRYLNGRAVNWAQGFVWVEWDTKDGTFHVDAIDIVDSSRFIWRGKRWEWKPSYKRYTGHSKIQGGLNGKGDIRERRSGAGTLARRGETGRVGV